MKKEKHNCCNKKEVKDKIKTQEKGKEYFEDVNTKKNENEKNNI